MAPPSHRNQNHCHHPSSSPSSSVGCDKFGAGQNATEANMSFNGIDIEDAIVMNKSSVDRGFGRCIVMKTSSAANQKCENNTSDRIIRPQKEVRHVEKMQGHRLENSKCKLPKELKQVENRLLLTGTPLHNNFAELRSLLNFILPDLFLSHEEFESWFDLSGKCNNETMKEELEEKRKAQVVAKLHAILRPCLVQRTRSDVELMLPRQKEILLYATMTKHQKNLQDHLINKTLETHLQEKVDTGRSVKGKLNNLTVQLRKSCYHPDLLESAFDGSYSYAAVEEIVEQCGKSQLPDRLLAKLSARNHNVPIFSQWTKIMDIVDYYFSEKGYEVCRIDGSVKLDERKRQIQEFNDVNSNYRIFLLSTTNGGLGISLAAADIYNLYDSDWNPQMGLQAMDLCHRIGRTKPVHVYRLATALSIECRNLKRAFSKLKIEHLMIGKGQFQQETTKSSGTDGTEVGYDIIGAGQNVTVAVMSFNGDGIEDAIVMNKSSWDRGFGWPEYCIGKTGQYVEKQARKYHTWSIAGYEVGQIMMENPSNLLMISVEDEKKIPKLRLPLPILEGWHLELPTLKPSADKLICNQVAILRGGPPRVFLVSKRFNHPEMEAFDVISQERWRLVEEDNERFGRCAIVAYDFDGWFLFRGDFSVFYFNVVFRELVELPNMDWYWSQVAEGAFTSSPLEENNRTIMIDLVEGARMIIFDHERERGWTHIVLNIDEDIESIASLSMIGGRLFFLLENVLYCCSDGGVEWVADLEVIEPPFVHFSSAIIERGGDLRLLLIGDHMNFRVLSIDPENGLLGEIFEEDIVGVAYTTSPSGGRVFGVRQAEEDNRYFCAGGLLGWVECVELSPNAQLYREAKRCRFEGTTEPPPCPCSFGWVRLGQLV